MKTSAFVGCSRGLGAAVLQCFSPAHSGEKAILVARNQEGLARLAESSSMETQVMPTDLAHPPAVEVLGQKLQAQQVARIFYFAGGGPYGRFADKNWRDHQWAWQVNFLSPAFLLHQLLAQDLYQLQQFVVVGSAIADDSPDPRAASYGAAKHALAGLIKNLIHEYPQVDLRFFRPGYMDTDLLPKNAEVRGRFQVLDPKDGAAAFVQWVDDPKGVKTLTLLS